MAGVVAVVSGLLATSSSGPASAAGQPVPASAIARLTAIAGRMAKLSGDARPVWVSVVRTSHVLALTSATPGDFVPGRDFPAYLITMRGRFTDYMASIPAGGKAPTGSYMSIVLATRNFRFTDIGLSKTPPPVSPASLGPVTYLHAPG